MRPMMSWLPVAPDFRADLGAALESPNPTDCLERLASLAQYRLGYLETLQLDRALGRLTLEPGSGFTVVRLAILASSTVDHLSPAIRVAGLRRRLMIDVHIGAYGQYRQDLLDPTLLASPVRPAVCPVLDNRKGHDCWRATHGNNRRSRRDDCPIDR